jgi:hypothetical protein
MLSNWCRQQRGQPWLAEYYLGIPQRQGFVLGYGGLTQQEIVAGTRRLVSVILGAV